MAYKVIYTTPIKRFLLNCMMTTATETLFHCTFITTDSYYNGKTDRVSDLIIYLLMFGEFDNFDHLLVESLWPRCLDNETGVSPLSWDL